MSTMTMNLNWANNGTSFKLDVMSLIVALTLHGPLYFMKFDTTKHALDRNTNRLVSVDLIDPEALKPPPVVEAAPAPKGPNLMERLKMMVKKEPPPPPPPKAMEKVTPKLEDVPKKIEIAANLKLPEKINPGLQTKTGFKTTADAKLIEQKQISLKDMGTGIAPISSKKLGTMEDRASIKNSKGNFSVSQKDSLQSIGGGSMKLADASAPSIAIHTGSKASTEKFSAPTAAMADKGRLGSVGVAGLGSSDAKLGLRDSIIARNAAPGQIDTSGSRHGVAGGVPGGVPGSLGTRKDMGRFQGGQIDGVVGGTGPGGHGTGQVSAGVKSISAPAKPAQKKSMFEITGELRDRKIERQVSPEYPGWAQAQGIEASVILEFTVDPTGMVKDIIVVRRTSGYPQLDQSAMKALRKWKFAPLSGDENRNEVGTITFNYSLS